MKEIVPGLWHWSTFHEGIGQPVHSYYLTATTPAILIDPREPDEGLDWFRSHTTPAHVFLTNRHHYRHSDRFQQAFGLQIWCHRDGLHEFTRGETVTPFVHGETLPGGVQTFEIGALCPEETALILPVVRAVALGDALIREEEALEFVPDDLMGECPEKVKSGMRLALTRLLEIDFDHLLMAHGTPWAGSGREALRHFLADR